MTTTQHSKLQAVKAFVAREGSVTRSDFTRNYPGKGYSNAWDSLVILGDLVPAGTAVSWPKGKTVTEVTFKLA